MYKSEREKEMIKREEDMIKVIYKMEKDFIQSNSRWRAWFNKRVGRVEVFRYFSELSKKWIELIRYLIFRCG